MPKKNTIDKKALNFLEQYINNPSPTGFESEGQKLVCSLYFRKRLYLC